MLPLFERFLNFIVSIRLAGMPAGYAFEPVNRELQGNRFPDAVSGCSFHEGK